MQVAEELRQGLPMRVDELTVWTTVSAAGPVLLYTYRMDFNAEDERLAGFDDRIQQLITTGVCSTPGMVRTMGEGAEYEYHYRSMDNVLLAEFRVNAAACQQ